MHFCCGTIITTTTTAINYIKNKSCSGRFDAEKSQNHTENPCSAAIYQLDSIVRRAPSLQATRDGRLGRFDQAGHGQLVREEAA